MTRTELMEDVYNKSRGRCSVGDITFALSKRFPKCQGNRHLKDGTITESHTQMAARFLKEKRMAKFQKSNQLVNKQDFFELKGAAFKFAENFFKQYGQAYKNFFRENAGYSLVKANTPNFGE